MSSRIEQVIDEIELFISECKYQTFSTTNIIVDKDRMDELLRDLRLLRAELPGQHPAAQRDLGALRFPDPGKGRRIPPRISGRAGRLRTLPLRPALFPS